MNETPRIHVSLRTADLDAAVAFYTRLLGEGPDKVRDGYARFRPAHTPLLLALMEGEPGVDHFGLRLPDGADTQAEFGRLELDGAEGVVCCHARKDEAWLRDPDGRPWEVYAVTDESPEVAVRPSGCCT
jgi:catechol 2,3-dioxygenase-like lactoylglutathione lyase family enzyme